jgi:hypothetical protein
MERIATMSLDFPLNAEYYRAGFIPDYSLDKVDTMISESQRLVTLYPDHHLANNLLNWMAWGYCYKANYFGLESNLPDYLDSYKLALATYRLLLADYPSGKIAKNAKRAIKIIEEKLANEDKRVPIDPELWYWSN